MPNPYFQFKQFTVYHDRCAMKVGTDGVLLGAWCDVSEARTALDIGTGTGLITLMMAQRNSDIVTDAIDIDASAIEQAKGNIAQSPFASRIRCSRMSLQSLKEHYPIKYDIIVSNPPFFVQSLKSPDKNRTLARHTDSLQMEELISIASGFLSDRGKLSVIYPHEYRELLIGLADSNGLYISRITNVYPTPSSLPKRVLIEFCKTEASPTESDLTIEKARHIYSDEFTALVREFYLKL